MSAYEHKVSLSLDNLGDVLTEVTRAFSYATHPSIIVDHVILGVQQFRARERDNLLEQDLAFYDRFLQSLFNVLAETQRLEEEHYGSVMQDLDHVLGQAIDKLLAEHPNENDGDFQHFVAVCAINTLSGLNPSNYDLLLIKAKAMVKAKNK